MLSLFEPILAELSLLDNIFKMAIFQSIFNFFEILKSNLVKIPERVMTIYFLKDILILRGPNPEKIMCKKCDVRLQFAICKLCLGYKSSRKQTPIFFFKYEGLLSSSFLSQAQFGVKLWLVVKWLLHPQFFKICDP